MVMDIDQSQCTTTTTCPTTKATVVKSATGAMAAAAPNGASIKSTLSLPKMPKTLTEHKLKRLNILTFINDKKEILFTKKAFKHEKERIWRQIFTKMLEFGMVSKEKDWRYVRDVSFSNWRKRAQKRLKHLAANGYRLNMDECEFLIYDILGKTPDKVTEGQEKCATLAETWLADCNADNMDDESDEYMIDSDEDDDDDVSFDEMLFVPKIVFSDNIQSEKDEMMDSESLNTVRQTPSKLQQTLEAGKTEQELNKIATKNSSSFPLGCNARQNGSFLNKCFNQAKLSMQSPNDPANFEQGSDQEGELNSLPNRYMNKFRELRLLDLEIENKVLKNRYMKLKIFQMEQNLGLEHCKEVKELSDVGVKGSVSKTTLLSNEHSAQLSKLSSTLLQQNKNTNNTNNNNSKLRT